MEISNTIAQSQITSLANPFAELLSSATAASPQTQAVDNRVAPAIDEPAPIAASKAAALVDEPPLTFQQINTLLATRTIDPTGIDSRRIMETLLGKTNLYAWLQGAQPDSLGPTGRADLAYFINTYSEFYSDQISSTASKAAISTLNRTLDSITTALWSGLPGLGASPTDADRVTAITSLFSQLGAASNARGGPDTLATRQRAVGLLAESAARTANVVEGYDNLPVIGTPSLETIANSRLVLLANRLSAPVGAATTFRVAAFASAIPILVASVREAPNRVDTIDKILKPLTQAQNQQVATAMVTNQFLDAFAFKSRTAAGTPVPGSYEKFFANISQSTLKDQTAQIFESVMLSLDKVDKGLLGTDRSRLDQVLGALSNVILQDPTNILFSLYKEDNIDTANVGNPNGRALSTYLKYMISGEKFSDLKAIASLITLPPNYTIPLNNDAVYNNDAVLNLDGTIKTPATLKTPATINRAQLNADQLATFNQTTVFSGRTEYPSVTARAYFIGSFGRALDKLKAEGANTDGLSKTYASAAIDVTKTVVGIFVPNKGAKVLVDLLATGAKAVAPSLFGSPSTVNEVLAGLTSVLTPRDPNNTERPLPVTYLITDNSTTPATTFAPLSFIATESARLRAATWGAAAK